MFSREKNYKKNKYKLIIMFISIFFILFLSLYWLKNQIGINFFETISLSKYFPFNYLNKSKIISVEQNGILLDEHFNIYPLFNNWLGMYTDGEKRNIEIRTFSKKNHSRSLSIVNKQANIWSLSHNKYVKVDTNDIFTFCAKVCISGRNPTANVFIDAVDENMKVMIWGYSNATTKKQDKWIQLHNKVPIDDERIKYIRLRIAGSGQGTYFYDDVLLKRKKAIKRTI